MRIILLSMFLILVACPKHKNKKTIEEQEREKRLESLLEEEEFDDIPENTSASDTDASD
ncbi:hypothetical protein OAA09_00910 [bacterium]|nr:hypothetical protein [bacterium]